MSQLLIQNFGPIRNDDAVVVEPRKISVFTGKQGTGKSTIAKLFSEFTWLEKALVRGDFTIKQLTRKGTFVKTYCAFHNIQNYFQPSTHLDFVGDKYHFKYVNQELKVEEVGTETYERPQVMYVPAERNFMTAIEHADKIKNLPSNLQTLQMEYYKALNAIKSSEDLPIDGFAVVHDKLNNITWLKNSAARIRMPEVASGFQSLVPLVLVSRNLQKKLNSVDDDNTRTEESSEESRRFENRVQDILNDNTTDQDTKKILLRQLAALRKNHRFVNIVEEMEQNLFPSSQRAVLFDLLRINNSSPNNQLVLTTHSPYVVSYLSLCVKAKDVHDKVTTTEQKQQVCDTIPATAMVAPEDIVFYEVTEDGRISMLPTYNGMPDDENLLNIALGDVGDIYEQLVDIEEQCNR